MDPIRPGSDAALVAGIAWVLIDENLVDQPFLDKYCVGYDEKTLPASAPPKSDYKNYILGNGPHGLAKTPAWASRVTGVPVSTIVRLARELGEATAAALTEIHPLAVIEHRPLTAVADTPALRAVPGAAR